MCGMDGWAGGLGGGGGWGGGTIQLQGSGRGQRGVKAGRERLDQSEERIITPVQIHIWSARLSLSSSPEGDKAPELLLISLLPPPWVGPLMGGWGGGVPNVACRF